MCLKLCFFFLLDIQKHSWRASGQEGPRGIGSGCEAHSARTRHNTTCIKQGYKTSAKSNSPWSPSQEGARGQGSSACRGTPSRGEVRALHHQPVPALTLNMPFVCVFTTAGPSTKLFACVWGGYWRTCATRHDEPRPVWTLAPLSTCGFTKYHWKMMVDSYENRQRHKRPENGVDDVVY